MRDRFELIVFDWDGTLSDSTATIVACIQAACRDLKVPEPDDALASSVIGLGLHEALRIAVPDLPEGDHDRLADRYRHHFLLDVHQIGLFPGVPEMLDDLRARGHLLAVATGKSRAGLDRVIAQSGLAKYFDATRCADETFSKPHPAMLLELTDALGVECADTVMVGDTTHDLLMAQNAKTAGVGVAYGAHPRAALEALQPLHIATDAVGLHRWLTGDGDA